MADLYEEYGLEMEADPSLTDLSPKESKEPVIKKSGGWIRSILALVLGIVIGVGAVAGGGYFAVTFPARTAIVLKETKEPPKPKKKAAAKKPAAKKPAAKKTTKKAEK